jgi:two-component system NtrC family sensor kinase
MDQVESSDVHRVLVIDDDPIIHDAIRKFLCSGRWSGSKLDDAEEALFGRALTAGKQSRFEVDSAFQGEEGLAKVYHAIQEDRPYAMTFLDINMPPGWSGIEVAPRLWVADPELQIVICTGNADFSWEDIFVKIGTSDRMFILKKPFDRMEVLQLAHILTARWRDSQKQQLRQKHLEQTLQTRAVIAERMSERLHTEIMRLLPDSKRP